MHNSNWEPYFTSDGGMSWNPAESTPSHLAGEVVHDNTQYALGDHLWATSTNGRVFYTNDKGHNWQVSPVANFQFPLMFRVAFFDPSEGIAVRYNYNTSKTDRVYRTHNGGQTWGLISSTGPVHLSYPAGALFIVPGSNIVISNGGGTSNYGSSYSLDFGQTWTEIDNTRRYGVRSGKDWNSLWAGQYSNTQGSGGIAIWDGTNAGIRERMRNPDFTACPNPSHGMLNIMGLGIITHLEITTLQGQTYYQAQPGTNTVSLRMDDPGIYFIRGTRDNQTITKKLVVLQ